MSDNLKDKSIGKLQFEFEQLDQGVKAAEGRVASMKAAYEEAAMILSDMKRKRGKRAYWLQLRKAQR